MHPPKGNCTDLIDPAILSCGPAHMETRIRYTRENLLTIQNCPLSRKQPQYIDTAIIGRRSWCRLEDLGEPRRYGNKPVSNGTDDNRLNAASSNLMPTFKTVKKPVSDSIIARKAIGEVAAADDGGNSSTTNQQQYLHCSHSDASLGHKIHLEPAIKNTTVSSVRRIGSGRISARDMSWNYNSEPTESNFRPSGGLLGLRDRPRVVSFNFDNQQVHRRDERNNYDRRIFNRDTDERNNSSHGYYTRYSFQTNSDRKRMYTEKSRTEEPEWFTDGPTSQHDIIELRGFDEPESNNPNDVSINPEKLLVSQSEIESNSTIDNTSTINNNFDGEDYANISSMTTETNTTSPPPARSTPAKVNKNLTIFTTYIFILFFRRISLVP